MEVPKINKDIIDLYKRILLTKLMDKDIWYITNNSTSSTKLVSYKIEDISNNTFEVVIPDSGGDMTFSLIEEYHTIQGFEIGFFDFKIKKEIRKNLEYQKIKKKIKEVEQKEKQLMNCLSNGIKRSLKIEKLKKKM